MAKVLSINRDDFAAAGERGKLMELLARLPCEYWAERPEYENTLLHYACFGPNVAAIVALVQSGLVNVNARNKWGRTPAHMAAGRSQLRVLEVLCAAGVDLRARDQKRYTPIDDAIWNMKLGGGCESVRVLIANGVRFSAVHENYRGCITPELRAFEQSVLHCRTVVVALLRVKKAGNLVRWDKFLLREVAYAVWATRKSK